MEMLNCLQSEELFPESLRIEPQTPLIAQCPPTLTRLDSWQKSKIQQSQGRKKKRFNKSLWTLQENMKYIAFLEQNRQLFESPKQNRRLQKINKLISLAIKTRSPDQCRSHHQKMIKYHTSIEGVIAHVHLLQSMHADESEMGEGNLPLRIRKKVSRSQTEEEQMCKVEEEEKDLWDVLCFEGSGLGLEQHLQYL